MRDLRPTPTGGLEIVADRETKAPFDPSRSIAAKVRKTALAHGLICYPLPFTRDGKTGDHVLLAPPFTVTDAQTDDLAELLEKTIPDVFLSMVPVRNHT